MQTGSEYKRVQCIKEMDVEFKEQFDEIVKHYAEKLCARVVTSDSAYTLHDFEHHCFDIYKIISDVLFDSELAYKNDYGLSPRELYILNLAVLFHDFGMFNCLGATRETHSKCSAEYLQNEYTNSRSVFRVKSGLTANEMKALKAIVTAHSNEKSAKDEERGIKASNLKDYKARIGKIRSRFLAGILRLADELDVSSERLGTAEIEQEIVQLKKNLDKEPADSDRIKEFQGYIKSLEHWIKLHYISSVLKNVDGKTIELVVDDEYVELCLDEGKTISSIARDLVEIYQKINKELEEIITVCFNTAKERNCVPVEGITFVTENSELKKKLDDNLSTLSLSPKKKMLNSLGRKMKIVSLILWMKH